ncbi:hypothetical protein HDU96_005518, partial [Phlyctochytrium bullatum]
MTVAFNPVTQTVRAVGMDELVAAAFFNRPCYGAVFALHGVSEKFVEEKLEAAFAESVDRTYMTYRFGAQFVGKDFARNVYTHIEADDEEHDIPEVCEPVLPQTVDGFTEATEPYPRCMDWGADLVSINRNFIEHLHAMREGFKEMERLQDNDYDGDLEEFFNNLYSGLGDDGPEPTKRYFRGVAHPTAAGKRDVATFIDARTDGTPCTCGIGRGEFFEFPERRLNDMVFDFSRNELRVVPDCPDDAYPDMCGSCAVDPALDKPFLLPKPDAEPVEVMKYRVDIAALGEGDAFESFNHASCQCDFPS